MNVLTDQFEEWRGGVIIDAAGASVVEAHLDRELPGLLRGIDETTRNFGTGAAFAEFVSLVCFLNVAAGFRASILEKVAKHVEELRDALRKIAARIEATSFDIGVSWPVGLSVTLTFAPSET